MMTNKLRNLFSLLSVMTLSLAATTSLADEIWVTPAAVSAEKEVGNWAVTDRGDTHFSFAVPNDLSSFVGAKVVLIGKKDTEITFDLFLSVSQDGLPNDVYTDTMADLGPEMLLKNQLREIDVSAIFPDFAPGMDYVTLHFQAKGREQGKKRGHADHRRRSKGIQVIGLRFQYDNDVFFDSATGNIGIGTTTPGSELEVNGTVAASAFASTSPLVLEAPAGTERLRIDDITGNVGIGTMSPGAKLDIDGNVAIGGSTVIDSSGQWVGDPTGLEGPAGADGAPGPQGPPGPAGTALAYAHVRADGTIDHDSGNIAVTKVGAGTYCIGVTGGTVHVAVASLDSQINTGGTVQTGVFHMSDCTASGNNDIFVVTREQTQHGGLPGSDKAFFILVN